MFNYNFLGMKKFAIIIFCFVVCAGVGLAQDEKGDKDKKTPEERAAHRTDKLTEKLSLNEEQKSQVSVATIDHFKSMKEMKSRMKALKEEMKAERDAYDSKIQSVLTQEQQIKYAEMKEERRKRNKDSGKRPHHLPHPEEE